MRRFSFIVSYIFSGKKENQVGGIKKTFSGGTAYIFDVGYRLQFGFFGIGPVVSFIHIDYKKTQDNTGRSDLSTKFDSTQIIPYVGLWFFYDLKI